MDRVMTDLTFPLLSISRLRMGIDGRGVTTLVAGAGCPLRCKYCINQVLLRMPAQPVTPQELYDRVKIDDLYFQATSGGVTFGGGESLLHSDFIAAFSALCARKWRISIETSLAVPRKQVATAARVADEFIVDIKESNEGIYCAYTGGKAEMAWGNLQYLLETVDAERIRVRVPLIPAYNTPEDCARTVERLQTLGLSRIERFSYIIK